MLDAALSYASRGWHVMPLKPTTKNQPLTTHGFKDATSEPGQVAAWWGRNPTANIGVAIEASGLILVDFDPRNKGEAWEHTWPSQDYDELLDLCVESGTLSATTGSGGRHFLFLAPDDLEDIHLRSLLASGVDFKHNGYFVAAPSVNSSEYPDGGLYQWDAAVVNSEQGPGEVKPLPAWLRDMAIRHDDEAEARSKPQDPNDLRPGTQFNALADIGDILTPHGWTLVRREGGTSWWCRPGKTDAISASWNHEDCGLFYVFSTSTEFEAGRGYDLFRVYAILNHGDDIKEAAREVKDIWLPQQPVLEITDEDIGLLFRDTAPAVEEEPEEWVHAFPADHFVTKYIRHHMKQTSASPAYAEAAALSLLAVASGQARAYLAPYPGGLRTNLYLCIVGASSRTYKSTSQDIMLRVLRHFRDGAILPAKSSTESMVDQLAQAGGLTKIWTPDEFGMAIAEIGRKDWMKGIEDLLLELYGGKRYDYQTLGRGLTTITSAHLSVFGASTPETLALGGATAMLGGLLPRFGIVFPRRLPPYRKAGQVDGSIAKEASGLGKALRLPQEVVQESTEVSFSDEAMACLNAAEERLMTEALHGARLPTMMFKVAMLSAVGDGRMRVTEEDAQSAVAVIDRWADGARYLQPYLRRKSSDLEFERSMTGALDVLTELGGTAPSWKIARQLRWPKSRFDQIESALVQQAYIRVDTGIWTAR